MCCGHEQNALNGEGTAESTSVKLLYFGQSYLQFRGAATGRLYHFSPLHPIQAVDPLDALSLTRTRLFRQIR